MGLREGHSMLSNDIDQSVVLGCVGSKLSQSYKDFEDVLGALLVVLLVQSLSDQAP